MEQPQMIKRVSKVGRHSGLHIQGKVFSKLFAITALVILLFYAVGVFLNSQGIAAVMKNLYDSTEADTVFSTGAVSHTLSSLAQMQQEFLYDATLRRFAITYDIMSAYKRTETIAELSRQLLRIKRFSTIVKNVSVYFPSLNRTISTTPSLQFDIDMSRYNMLTKRLFAAQEQPFIAGEDELVLTAAFPQRTREDVLCLIELTLLPDVLVERMHLLMAMPEVNIALMDSQGGFYALTEGVGELMDAAMNIGSRDDVEFTHGGKRYIAQEGSLTPLGLTAMFFFPIDARLEPLLNHRRWFVILTVVAAGLLGCYLLFFKRAVFTPMKAVYAAMERMGEGDEFLVDERSNELRAIYEQFARMIARVKNLSAEVYEEKYRAQQAEMMQLQMQIRPHFFYNTLFSIYRMAQHEGSEDIAFLSQHLSSYYAYITRAPRDVVPLSSEINHMRDYLEIQRFRFGRRIAVTVDSLPEEISRERIPPLVIQPLVENAFEHGLHDKEEDGHLNVSFQWSEDSFCVIVTDNGGKMDELSVTKLRAALEQGTLHESGALMNLHRRLQIRYGKGYGLSLSSVDNSLRAVVSFGRHNKSGELEE